MKLIISNLKKFLYITTAIILLIGFSSAILIYLKADKDSDKILGYEVRDGYVYPISPKDSKKYKHDLELYGGKMNVLTNEIMRWFDGLWHGKTLSFTVACITIIISLGVFLVAYHLSQDLKSDATDENDQVISGKQQS